MNRSTIFLLLALPTALAAQRPGGAATQLAFAAPREASQFDFLIGQWELTVTPQVSGLAARIHGVPRMSGTWKAWRAFDGFGIEDELRIVDGSGNPMSLSHALRIYSATQKGWRNTGLDVYRATYTTSTGAWQNAQMVLSASGTDAEGKPTLTRTRFHDITANSFKYQQDRSGDGGRTWTEGVLKIAAKRVAAVAPR